MEFQPQKFLQKLQDKPYDTRVKILWGVVIGAAVLLIALWAINLKSSLSGLDGQTLIKPDVAAKSTTTLTDENFVAVEAVEQTASVVKIYFNVNNSTDDILNFASMDGISLNINGQTLTPKKITDRQNQNFVQKVLSHTTNFGILFFEPIDGDNGTLTVDELSFEAQPDQIFKQVLNLNFKELKRVKLRN